MPRTIEHIVSTHQAARALRAAGKPIWAHQVIGFKAVLRDHDDLPQKERVLALAPRLVAKLRLQLPKGVLDDPAHPLFSFDLHDAVGELEDLTAAYLAELESEGEQPLDVLDHYLTAIYDWADVHRVWID